MKTLATIVCLLFGSMTGFAQLTVTSILPADHSSNVPLIDTLSITFSTALDTTVPLDNQTGILTNIDSLFTRFYSADHRTVNFPVSLKAGTLYFVVVYYAKSQGGLVLESPATSYFTTGSSFSGHTVSGTVQAGSSGSGVDNVLVGLSIVPLSHQSPIMVTGAITNGAGAFTVPYVPDGVYWPVAAKDVNHNGMIDGTGGDVIASGDSIVVAGSNLSGVTLVLQLQEPLSFLAALDSIAGIVATLPPDNALYGVAAWDADSLGRSEEWDFYYFADSMREGYKIVAQAFGTWKEPMDSNDNYTYRHWKPILNPSLAANPAVFLANAESNGGSTFRQQPQADSLRFNRYLKLGSLQWCEFTPYITDPFMFYWGASYAFLSTSGQMWYPGFQKLFVGDFTTGALLAVTGVKENTAKTIPERADLHQNYPNPFNPATTIRFSLPGPALVSLRVYDILGREVTALVNGFVSAGEQSVRFDAQAISSGVYFYRLTATSASGTVTSMCRSMLVLK